MHQFVVVEIKRLLKSDFFSKFQMITLMLWPGLVILEMWYGFMAFPLEVFERFAIIGRDQVFLFLILGHLSLLIFNSLVQSAWGMQFEKRQGTLEGIFMTPVNRLVWLYSRCLAVLLSNSFIFMIGVTLVFLLALPLTAINLGKMLLVMLLILFSGVIWGGFLITLFFLVRDGTLLYSIFEGLQGVIAGIQIPISVYPLILRSFASLFPLTYTVLIVRGLFFQTLTVHYFLMYAVINAALVIATVILFSLGEKYLRKNGNFNLY